MFRRHAYKILLSGLVVACGSGVDDESTMLGELEQPIVRGQAEDGFDQVVLLENYGAGGGRTRCSGTLIDERTILTAAHCLRPDSFLGGFFVYYGNNYDADLAQLPNIPPPGRGSVWALATNWVAHPDYDPTLNYPDVAIVEIDRNLPVKPLPLLKSRLDRHDVGKKGTLVGWGASGQVDTTFPGVGVKRSGRATILGSPTEADFHPEDPNPGILDPNIRRDLLKLNGEAPNAAICAGDSGGPLIVKEGNKSYVAGVSFWGGVGCEGYSMYTRIDAILDFIKSPFSVVPRLECVDPQADGTYTAYFGYRSQNGVPVEVPYSRFRNFFPQDEAGARPSVFNPGDHAFDFGVDFTRRERLTYRLDPPQGPTTTLFVDKHSRRCDPADPQVICAHQCEASFDAECTERPAGYGFGQCVTDCGFFQQAFPPECQTQANAYLTCWGNIPPAAENWFCSTDIIPQPVSPLCEAEFFEVLACAGFL